AQGHTSVDGPHLDFPAQHCVNERDVDLSREVVATALKTRVWGDGYHEIEVTVGPATDARTSFAGNADTRPRLHARRDLHLQTTRPNGVAGAITGMAHGARNLAAAATGGTGLCAIEAHH